MSSGTQKGTEAIKPGPTMIRPFMMMEHLDYKHFLGNKVAGGFTMPHAKSSSLQRSMGFHNCYRHCIGVLLIDIGGRHNLPKQS